MTKTSTVSHLTQDQVLRLEVFVLRLDRLRRFLGPALKGSIPIVPNMDFEKDEVTSTNNPLNELREAAVINELRSFTLRCSQNNFSEVKGVLILYYKNRDKKKMRQVKSTEEMWKYIMDGALQNRATLPSGKSLSTNEELFDMFVNGVYAHTDGKKLSKYLEFSDHKYLDPFLHLQFTRLAVDAFKFLDFMYEIYVKEVLSESKK